MGSTIEMYAIAAAVLVVAGVVAGILLIYAVGMRREEQIRGNRGSRTASSASSKAALANRQAALADRQPALADRKASPGQVLGRPRRAASARIHRVPQLAGHR